MLNNTVSDSYYRWSLRIILGLLIAIALLTFRDYGVTWDEELQSQYGLAVVDYYMSFFKDHRFLDIFNLYLYGGTFDGLASVIDRILPFNIYETRHLCNAICGIVGLWGVWRLGKLIGGSAVGILALVFTALTPMYYGHMFNNPKDIPFAAGLIWSLYGMGRCFTVRPAPSLRNLVRLGIIYGLTLGVRIGGIMFLFFWCVPWVLNVIRTWRKDYTDDACKKAFKLGVSSAFKIVLPVCIISYAVMLVCWPWSQLNPIANPLRALSEFSNFPQDVEVLLNGTTYRSTQLPWTYVPNYFAVQLPEFLLLLLGITVALAPRLWRSMPWPRQQIAIMLVLSVVVPTSYAIIRHPALYDAVRHFLFVVPILCIFAAMSCVYIYDRTVEYYDSYRQLNRARWIAGTLLALVVAYQTYIMVALHPYQYIYVNRLGGGVHGAFGQYELDYWGSSFKEAAEKLQNYVNKEGGVPPGKIYKIAICGPWDSAMLYLPPDYEPVIANEPAEFFLATTRWMCPDMREGREIINVSRMGTPLSVVKDLRDKK
ncbi:MAG: glycosyltransferase family 39 protein [Alphaproteobacteria bacterium]|nr:glycosyltransferase family 39 protein [Alphaproteobacteria bacterium]